MYSWYQQDHTHRILQVLKIVVEVKYAKCMHIYTSCFHDNLLWLKKSVKVGATKQSGTGGLSYLEGEQYGGGDQTDTTLSRYFKKFPLSKDIEIGSFNSVIMV